VTAAELATTVLQEIAARAGLAEGDVDDVVLGQCYPNGEAPAIGRVAALDAGLGTGVPGLQIDRRCGSGLQAILHGVMQIASGSARLVVAGGVESMSQVEHHALGLRGGIKGEGVQLMDSLARGRVTAGGTRHPVDGGMVETAENVRRDFGISRESQDELALRSQQAWTAAHDQGKFDAEIVSVQIPGKRGAGPALISIDEHPRPQTTRDELASLRPMRIKLDRTPP
jgi:acetyl-CoA C-acetyltransferase